MANSLKKYLNTLAYQNLMGSTEHRRFYDKKYLAFCDGELVDNDPDISILAKRLKLNSKEDCSYTDIFLAGTDLLDEQPHETDSDLEHKI